MPRHQDEVRVSAEQHVVKQKKEVAKKRERKKKVARYLEKSKKARAAVEVETRVLKPAKPVVVYIEPPPVHLASYQVTPVATAQPTIAIVNTQPWGIMPRSNRTLPALAGLGAILILVGTEVIVSIAVQGVQSLVDSLLYTISGNRNVKVRFHTGKGFGRGQYLRIRAPGEHNEPPGGAVPNEQNTDPAEDHNSRWYEFWDWSF